MSTPSAKHVPLPGTERLAPPNATDLGPTSPKQAVSISVIVRRKNHLDLRALGGRHISRQEFNERYAGNPADFAALRQFAHNHNLSVDESASSLARRTMVLRGTAQAMEAAFGVQLRDYELNGHKFHSFKGAVSMPATHAAVVETVLGLDCRPIAKPHHRVRGITAKATPNAAQDPSYTPMQVAGFYNFPTGVTGSGQTIGIIELGGGYNSSDLQTYFSGLGLTPPNVVSVSVDGGVNSPTNPNSADGEVALDIEVAGAAAPGANIAVYFTPNTAQGFLDAITTASHDTTNSPSVISISWGGPESGWTQSQLTAIDNACLSAAAMGITITVAAGDDGSSDGASGNNVDFPGSSPHVLCCGGTKITTSGTQITSEVVWNDGAQGGATGGGVSTFFAVPSWQNGLTSSLGPLTGRGVPDVAGDASPTSGYNILVDGTQEVVGGTSAVAPLWAALIALINQQTGKTTGLVNPILYAAPSALNDITQGNNGAFSAGPGWDACTGLGSPIGTSVAQSVAAAASGTGTTGGSGTGSGGTGSGSGSGGTGSGGGSGNPGRKHHPHPPHRPKGKR